VLKGQTSIETLFIVAIVLVVAAIVYAAYSVEASRTIAETTIRTQVDLALANAGFVNATCAGAQLAGLALYEPSASTRNYTIQTVPAGCAKQVFTTAILQDIHGRVTEALGCSYRAGDAATCKGKTYIVHA